jgi:hypothetical protein
VKRSLLMFLLLTATTGAFAQGRGGRGRGAPPTGKGSAPFDMTGYWVSVVGEDWRWRMFPAKGDYGAAPLNGEARRVADSWDPAKDAAAGEQCKGYAAPVIMRVPGRLHVTWQDDQTLKMETDAGSQTRVFYFGNPTATLAEGWQGVSKAEWDPGNAGAGGLFGPPPAAGPAGSLKIVTTKMRPGYMTRNGAPYSANATLTEYYDLIKEKNGVEYLLLTSVLEDPAYLTQPMWTAVHFKKQKDAAGWNPVACGK